MFVVALQRTVHKCGTEAQVLTWLFALPINALKRNYERCDNMENCCID